MCGIVVFNWHDEKLLREMMAAVKDRGPDESGYYLDECVSLGHQRLKVIDLLTRKQPLHNEDGSIQIVYNGEIYNYLELKEGLLQKGHRFYTNTDTEVIVHAYEEYDTDCVNYLEGMFAFAIWDVSQKRLFLARDRLGIKLLYYYIKGNKFIFASEMKAILKYDRVSRDIDLSALNEFFAYRYVPSERTLIENVYKLLPGYVLTLKDGKIVGQYPLIFMNLKIGGEILRASQNIDLMTHPDYQHQGIFSKLERIALDNAKEDGAYITIGFPNYAAYPGHIKSGWFDVAAMQVMFKSLNWNNTLRIGVSNIFLSRLCATGASLVDKTFYRAQEPHLVEGLVINRVPFFDDRINEFWANISNHYKIMVVRDRNYLNWRYVTVPDVDYSIYIAEKAAEIWGYLVLRCMERDQTKVGIIFVTLAQSQNIAQCLVSEAIKHCEQEKADLVYYSMIANKTHIKGFRRNGFISVSFIKGGRFCAHSNDPNISREFLRDPENWLVQLGDSDMI